MRVEDFVKNYIFKRRSIRKFQDKTVSDKQIKLILEAGMSAPSAWNRKPWSFIVIKERKIIEKLSEIHIHARMCKYAQVIISVLGKDDDEKWIEDCSAATQNMLLTITAMGLGSVWVDIRDVHYKTENDEITAKKLLKVPADWRILNLLPIGYPAEYKDSRTQYDNNLVFVNQFGNGEIL